MSEEFIPVLSARIDGQETNAVSAKELWEGLGVGRDFFNWIKGRIKKYQFVEGVDFVSNGVLRQNGRETPLGGRPETDYILTLDMAKELAMVENNEQGRKTRQYFIRIEKDHKQLAAAMTEGKIKGLIEAHAVAVKDIQLALTTAHNEELERIGEACEELEETAEKCRDDSRRWMQRAHFAEEEVAQLEKERKHVRRFGEIGANGIPKTRERKPTFYSPRSMAEASLDIQLRDIANNSKLKTFVQQLFDFGRGGQEEAQ